ncbi:hypothetical protein BS78_06G048300 [Paspalum vaginatum]|nr:hypothetical protein BS78_06G048300 [Paspalum vaginatum]
MAFALLPSLCPHDRHAVVCARVCQKWELRGGTNDGSIVHLDLILTDEKGNNMYAEIPKTEIERKGPLVEEGNIFIISHFRVSNAKDTFMPVPGNYMIEFTYHTLVDPVIDSTLAIPELVYHLTPFADLEQHAGVHSRFIDVIGVLVEVSDTKTVHLMGKATPTITRDIVLRDLSYFEIKVTLWGHRASSFTIDTVYDPNESKPVVVLLVGTIVKTYQGHYLSGSAACRWFFNPPIPQANTFYNRSHNFHDTCYHCTVVIAHLVPGERWWFFSCARCNKSCIQQGSGYKCMLCLSTVSKYKVAFVATNGTAEAQMICFGDVATRIIGKLVQQLMRAGRPNEDFPPDIAALVSLKFTFAIMLTGQSFEKPEKSYRVLSVLGTHGRQASVPHSVITATNGHGRE